MTELSKIREGDTVDVPMLVRAVGSDSLKLRAPGFSEGLWFQASDIIAHHPAPRKLEVGDTASINRPPWLFHVVTILAVDGDRAWVRLAPNHTEILLLSDLEPSDE